MKNENIIKVDYSDEMEQSYINYAMSVIVQRALPDIRDGLKPVHRRILYSMKDLNLNPGNPYKKSARIVGDVLGKYHPHSDTSVYEAMVRLSQDFSINCPLVDGQGNFGSIDGDGAAAMRYTEARLSHLATYMLGGLDKNIVEFSPNFDNSLKEPNVLPSRFFNLLVNGSMGIAVGMSTNIPPHNLKEVNSACIAYLRDENIDTKSLMKYIKGPDFPTGGTIVNKDDLYNIYKTGTGRVRVRSIIEEEALKGGRNNLIITEIPYSFSGNKTRLLESLIDLVNDRKLDELSDIRDESSKDGIRIVLEVKRGIDLENLKLKLFQNTRLEDTVSINMLSIVDEKPMILPLDKLIKNYMEFLKDLFKKEIQFNLSKLKKDKEIQEGLIRAYNEIDLIIDIIRGSKDRESVYNCLVNGYSGTIKFKDETSRTKAERLFFTETQAKSIMKMQLQSLVGLEIDKINSDLSKTLEGIKYNENLLANKDDFNKIIIDDLEGISKDHGKKRKTRIKLIEAQEPIKEEKVVEEVYALIDRFNYIKIIDLASYSRTAEDTLNSYRHIIKAKSDDFICIFSKNEKVYQIKIEELPISKINDRGTPLQSEIEILSLDSKSNLINKEILFCTKLGYVKRVDFEEFDTIRRETISTKVSDDDELLDILIISASLKEIILTTDNNRKIRFNIDEIPKQKKMARGVIGMNLNQGDFISNVELDIATDKDKRKRGSKGVILDQESFI